MILRVINSVQANLSLIQIKRTFPFKKFMQWKKEKKTLKMDKIDTSLIQNMTNQLQSTQVTASFLNMALNRVLNKHSRQQSRP